MLGVALSTYKHRSYGGNFYVYCICKSLYVVSM